MPVPGQGGLQVMRRSLDTIVPQVSDSSFHRVWLTVSSVSLCPKSSISLLVCQYLIRPREELMRRLDSTVFGENIHRSDQYFYHRIEANLPCPTCHMVPLAHLCATCPGDIAVHVQHSMPLPRRSLGDGSGGKSKHAEPATFDPACESCPTCSGQSVLPAQDPNFHLCGCEIEGRAAAYCVIWDEPMPIIAKVEES